jgi:hypothetical protein
LFAWVKANSFWIPYRGVLRGPVGVLMDGRGNSLDRSLLLADLLKRAGHTVRLAHAQLPQQDAAARLPALVARESGAVDASGATSFNGAGILNATTTRLAVQKQDAARTMATLDTRVANQTRRLLQLLAPPDATEEWSNRFGAALVALQDHWWVQRQTPAGWVDMDALSNDGRAIAAVQNTERPEDLGMDGLYHEITLRVVAEQWTPGSLAEHVALEQTLRPADLIGRSIALQFWPTAPIKSQTPAGRDELKNSKGAEWAAMLMIDRDVASAGILPESGDDPDQPQQGGAFGGIAGGFNSTFAPPVQQRAASKSTLSAVWLEYEFKAPGEEPRKIRRTVFDLVGPARRNEGAPQQFALDDASRTVRDRAMMMRNEMLPVTCAIAPEFITHLVSQSLLGNRQLLLAATKPGVTQDAVVEIARQSAPTVTSLYALALAATANGSRATYVDRPLLFTNHAYPKPGKESVIVEATDIVANDIGVSLAAKDAFATRVGEGVRYTNAESLLHGPEALTNTADAFAQPGAWVALTASDETDIAALTMPADARRRILDEVMNGQVVVAPRVALSTASGPFAGWWRVDPATGTTLGFGLNGWGVAATEHSANSSRAGATGRVFISAFKRFTAGFIGAYAFCVLPKITDSLEGRSSIGIKLTITDSAAECSAQGAFWGALATLPLVALTINRSSRAPRVPAEPPPPELPNPPEAQPPCPGSGPGGTRVMPGRPGSGGTQPMPARPGQNGASPPVGSAPPGPYQAPPDFLEWHREAYAEQQASAGYMGSPKVFEWADTAARSTYNGALSRGASPAEAYQASHDMWFAAYKQAQGTMLDIPGGWGVGSEDGLGATVQTQPRSPLNVPGETGAMRAQPQSPSSLEMAETGAAPARTPATPSSPPNPATESSPPRGSPPPGPHQAPPDFKDWHAEAYAEGQTSAQTMGTPKTFEYADQAARSAYNRAVAGGANPAQAYQASHDAWFTAYRQAPVVGRAPEATMQIPGSPPQSPSPSSLEMADTGAAPAPARSPKASSGPVPRQSPNASSGPVPQRPPLQQQAPGSEIGPISPESEANAARQSSRAPPAPKVLSLAEAQAEQAQALSNYKAATAAYDKASLESIEATGEWVRYRSNRPNPAREWPGDPENYNEATDQQLQNASSQKSARAMDLWEKYDAANKALIEANERYSSALFRQQKGNQCGGL